jgi:thiol-disulfide isomerase/thioredoxin
MKFNPCLPLLILLLFCTQAIASHEATEPSDGTVNSFRWLQKPIPLETVSIHNNAGQEISLSEFEGKIVLLNLWASWCPPCIRELPALDRLQQRLGDAEFVIVAVSLDKDPQVAREMFLEKLSITNLELYIEPAEQIGRFFPVDVLPANFIIDKNSQAIGMLRSYADWDAPEADALFNRLISEEK